MRSFSFGGLVVIYFKAYESSQLFTRPSSRLRTRCAYHTTRGDWRRNGASSMYEGILLPCPGKRDGCSGVCRRQMHSIQTSLVVCTSAPATQPHTTPISILSVALQSVPSLHCCMPPTTTIYKWAELLMVVPPPPSHPWTVHVGVVVEVCHTVAAVVELLGLDLSGNGDRFRVVGANYFPQDEEISRGVVLIAGRIGQHGNGVHFHLFLTTNACLAFGCMATLSRVIKHLTIYTTKQAYWGYYTSCSTCPCDSLRNNLLPIIFPYMSHKTTLLMVQKVRFHTLHSSPPSRASRRSARFSSLCLSRLQCRPADNRGKVRLKLTFLLTPSEKAYFLHRIFLL